VSEIIVPRDYYVYTHRKETTGEIFYVGKGSGNRAWSLKRSNHWKNINNKHGCLVDIVQDGLQEWAAFELEVDLISLHGRNDLGLGKLINLTNGGDGASGYIPSFETRKKIGKLFIGKKQSSEHIEKRASSRRGKKHSFETLEKMKFAKRKQTNVKPIQCLETGVVFDTGCCAERWLKQNINPKAQARGVYLAAKGVTKSAYGFHWKYA
jgi:hypothetical protein